MKPLQKIIILLLILIPSALLAQNMQKAIVYLHNGSILKGTIIDQKPGVSITLKSSDRSIWVFKQSEIDSIVTKNHQGISNKKYSSMVEAGVIAGNTNNDNNAPFTLAYSLNRRINNQLSAGAGVGIELFNQTYIPIFAEVRYRVLQSGTSPFLHLQGGFELPVGDYREGYYQPVPYDMRMPSYYTEVYPIGGWAINPAVGYSVPLNDNLNLLLSAGYRYMRHSYKNSSEYRMDVDYHRLSLRIGLQF